jgi:hypothetical protein
MCMSADVTAAGVISCWLVPACAGAAGAAGAGAATQGRPAADICLLPAVDPCGACQLLLPFLTTCLRVLFGAAAGAAADWAGQGWGWTTRCCRLL